MPIFRINTDLHYFAHVPKCGGTAVAAYLTARFGPLALCETDRHRIAAARRWSRSAAEHLPADWLARIMPEGWLASSFSVVRHPWHRLVSAFHFRRDMVKSIAPGSDFNAFVAGMPDWLDSDPFRHEGHFARQTSYVPAGSRIFRLEEGLDRIIPYLDGLAGNSDGPRTVAASNVGKWRHDQPGPVPTERTLDILARLYAEDFTRFDYPVPATADDVASLADLPVLAATGAPPVPGRRTLMQRLHRALQQSLEKT